jgi:hypothetical protein
MGLLQNRAATAERGAVPSEGRCDLEAGCRHLRSKLDRGRGTQRCPIPALPGPSGDALECHFVALLGIVVQATTFVARLVVIPVLQQRALGRICSAAPYSDLCTVTEEIAACSR